MSLCSKELFKPAPTLSLWFGDFLGKWCWSLRMNYTNPAPHVTPPTTQAISQHQGAGQAVELNWILSFCCSHSDNQSPSECICQCMCCQNTHTAVLRGKLPLITGYNFSWLPAGFCWNLKIRLKLPMWALLLYLVLLPDLSWFPWISAEYYTV